MNQKLLAGSALLDGLDREYTLNEIAIITRAGPARLLGLRHKGHLGVGADADVTIYSRQDDIAAMFASPRYVLKQGELVVEEGQLRLAPTGRRLYVRPAYDDAVVPGVRSHFDRYSTVQFDNYPVQGLPERAARRSTDDEDPRRPHRGHLRRGVHHARRRGWSSPPASARWAREAALKLTGFATSVIGCKCEAGIERELTEAETPDGRPGVSVLLMVMAKDDLSKRLIERVGQTVLTCPTTACYDGLPDAPDRVKRRRGAALLRRRLPGEQGDRRASGSGASR